MIIKGYIFSVLYALVCLALGFALYKIGLAKKITRKIVHILVGAEWIILYHFMGPNIHFLAVCLLFLVILVVSYKTNLMPMISSDGDNSPGTVYYAVAMSIMAAITVLIPKMILPFGIGVFCTSFGDGLAGLIGQCVKSGVNKKIYGNKTLIGAVVNLISCFLVAFIFDSYFNLGLSLWHCIAIAILALELELFTGRGLDNISITLGTSVLSYLFINFEAAPGYIIPILLTPLIIVFAYKKKALTISGIISAIIVDILISVSLGNFGFVVLLSFFVGGVIVDKIKKYNKKIGQNSQNEIVKRGDCRDSVQVLANGAIATVCAILYMLTDERIFVIAFVASLAEAFADTAASGIGVLSGQAFDPFRMKPCSTGVSGGMSILGTLASLVAATIISALSLIIGEFSIGEGIAVVVAAFLGVIFDSALGSLLQIKYKCIICGAIVEREDHCGTKTKKYSGLKLITNDSVNFLGTLFAAIVAILLVLK